MTPDLSSLRGTRAVVVGLGDHGGGRGVIDFLVAVGVKVCLSESRPATAYEPETLTALAQAGVECHFGGHSPDHLDGADFVVRSPGVPAGIALLELARRRSIPVEMEMTLFHRMWPGPIVGVTGTKGKSTTSTLCHAVLSARRRSILAGNMRVCAVERLLEPTVGRDTYAVLELSSFQLEGMGEHAQSPRFSVITNLDEDHLTSYGGSLRAYWEAKTAIFRSQTADDWLVLPGNDSATTDFVAAEMATMAIRPRLLYFSGSPLAPEVDGSWLDGGTLWRRVEGEDERVIELSELSIDSEMALLDLCAAVSVAGAAGMTAAEIAEGCLQAREVPDRREFVKSVGGIDYYNDTTATAPRAAVGTVESFPARPLVVIAGGVDKGPSLEVFAEALAEHALAVVLLEHDRYDASLRIGELLAARRYDAVSTAVSMAEAVRTATDLLGEGGGVVLLSPAAASFGMFDNEFHRGEMFRAALA